MIRGIEDHGEEFEFAVQHSPDGRGAGTGVDASAPKYTDWYKEEAETSAMKLVTGEETDPLEASNTRSQKQSKDK